MDRSPTFDLDSDIDLESPFLQSMLSDTRMSPTLEQVVVPAATAGSRHSEMRDCEPTEDDWENM